MIAFQNIVKKYHNKWVLDNFSLFVKKGEILALLGQNGAGKTTIIQLLLGFEMPNSGLITLHNKKVEKNGLSTQKYVAYVPDEVAFYPQLNALENLGFFASLSGYQYTSLQLKEVLLQVGLDESIHLVPVGHFSKGMKQKLAIAIAIAKKPLVLVLDEPTNGLDPLSFQDFSGLLAQLSLQGITVFVTTHDLFWIRHIAHRVAILKEGTILHTMPISKTTTAHDLEQLYLQTI